MVRVQCGKNISVTEIGSKDALILSNTTSVQLGRIQQSRSLQSSSSWANTRAQQQVTIEPGNKDITQIHTQQVDLTNEHSTQTLHSQDRVAHSQGNQGGQQKSSLRGGRGKYQHSSLLGDKGNQQGTTLPGQQRAQPAGQQSTRRVSLQAGQKHFQQTSQGNKQGNQQHAHLLSQTERQRVSLSGGQKYYPPAISAIKLVTTTQAPHLSLTTHHGAFLSSPSKEVGDNRPGQQFTNTLKIQQTDIKKGTDSGARETDHVQVDKYTSSDEADNTEVNIEKEESEVESQEVSEESDGVAINTADLSDQQLMQPSASDNVTETVTDNSQSFGSNKNSSDNIEHEISHELADSSQHKHSVNTRNQSTLQDINNANQEINSKAGIDGKKTNSQAVVIKPTSHSNQSSELNESQTEVGQIAVSGRDSEMGQSRNVGGGDAKLTMISVSLPSVDITPTAVETADNSPKTSDNVNMSQKLAKNYAQHKTNVTVSPDVLKLPDEGLSLRYNLTEHTEGIKNLVPSSHAKLVIRSNDRATEHGLSAVTRLNASVGSDSEDLLMKQGIRKIELEDLVAKTKEDSNQKETEYEQITGSGLGERREAGLRTAVLCDSGTLSSCGDTTNFVSFTHVNTSSSSTNSQPIGEVTSASKDTSVSVEYSSVDGTTVHTPYSDSVTSARHSLYTNLARPRNTNTIEANLNTPFVGLNATDALLTQHNASVRHEMYDSHHTIIIGKSA